MQIIIPAAGKGTRFKDSEFTKSKPLIEWNGKTMIEHVISNFYKETNKIFVIKQIEDSKEIENCYVKNINFFTEGPAITASLVRDSIDLEDELIITNCDQIIRDWEQDRFLRFARKYDAVLGCFISNEPHNSYIRVDSLNRVIEVKEKEVISNIATNGLHYWKKASYFFDSLQQMIDKEDKTKGEYYIAPTFNYLINRNYKVSFYIFNEHFPIGTPIQLRNFLDYENK